MKRTDLQQTIDWEVYEEEMKTIQDIEIPGFKVLQRDDDGSIIHVHKQAYSVFPNKKLQELTERLAKIANGEVLGYETFRNGAKVLGFIQPGQPNKDVAGDRISDKLVVGNSHDGTSGVILGTSTVVHRCQNMFSSILKDQIIRHSGDLDIKMEEVLKAYKLYYQQQNKLYQQFEQMKKVEISSQLIESLTNRLFDIDNKEEMSTRKANLVTQFNQSLEKELSEVGSNLWGFFNGVTNYTTHVRQKHQNNYLKKNSTGHVFGSNAEFNRKALRMIEAQMS